jgi:putative ABC transport system permease protein
MLDWLRYDVRHALRRLLHDRVFTVVALLSIGLGVGANSAIFSLVDQALYRQLPVREPERLVLLNWKGGFVGAGWGSGNLLPHPLFRDLKAQNQVFEGMFARHPTWALLSIEGPPEPVNTEIVSGSYFGVLGVGAALGRVLDESDDVTPEAHPVVVLSFDYWKTRLGGRADVVGRKVLLNNYPMTVVGVAAAGFRGVDWGEVPSLWVPTMMKKQATPDFDWLDDRRGSWLHVFGRLKPGLSVAQAAAGLQPWFKAMLVEDMRLPSWPVVTEEQRQKFLASSLEVLPAAAGRSDLRRRLEQPLLVLLAATSLVLLLACLNVANLCLARAFARRRETALRLAIGASRGCIVRELLVQSGLLALAGALLGMLVAPLVTSGLVSFLPDAVDLSTAVNARMFSFALFAALSTGLLFGLVPALQASRTQPGFTLKEESLSVAGGLGLRKALVVGQITLALVLLIGAGLFVRTLSNLRSRGPGFSMSNLLTFGVNPGSSAYSPAQGRQVMLDLLASLRALPEVQSASISTATLLGGGSWNQQATIESDHRFTTDRSVHIGAVSPGFFASLQAPILDGRDFDDHDAQDGPPFKFRSVIVNESLARRYFGAKSPIGARLGLGNRPDTKAEMQIVGVVKTFSYRGIREDEDQAFVPFLESQIRGTNYYVRTRTPSTAAFASIRAAAQRVDPGVPLTGLRTLDDQLDRSLSSERLLAMLATAFAGLAVLLAVVGLYGVTSFVVSRRTREIGIRMALGATRGAARWLIVRDTVLMVTAGILIALPAVWGLGKLVQSQLFGVAAMDGSTIAGAAALITLTALTAAALPAHRAASLNPVEALRCE